MPIEGYMVFMNNPQQESKTYMESESQVKWVEKNGIGSPENKFINYKEAADQSAIFEIEEWGFGVERVLSTASASQSGGIGTGSATFNEFTITRKIDRASPQLFRMACAGTTFKRVSLCLRKATGVGDGSGQTYLRYDFRLVGVKSVTWSHAEDAPTEEVALEYGAMFMQYAAQAPDGTLQAPKIAGWNRITNLRDETPMEELTLRKGN